LTLYKTYYVSISNIIDYKIKQTNQFLKIRFRQSKFTNILLLVI